MHMTEMVPELRFPEFNDTWTLRLFDEITDITRLAGYEYSQYWKEDINKEIIALRGYNIGKGKLVLNNVAYISDELSMQLIRSRLSIGDIVYPCVGTIGNAVVIDENDKFHIQQNIAKISPKENTDSYFLAQFLMSDLGMREVLRFNATSSQPNVLVGSLRKFKIYIPTYKEQQKIASFLSSVDDKISQLEKKKTLLETYKRGIMQRIFSQELRFKDENGQEFPEWEEKTLDSVCKKVSLSLQANEVENKDGIYKVYGASGIMGKIDTYQFDHPYIAIVKDGSGVGNLHLCEKMTSAIGTMDAIFSKEDQDLFFIYLLLSRINFRKYKVGSSIPHIYFRDYRIEKILIPCLNEQLKVSSFISNINRKIEITSTQLEKTREFKKGLLQQMFV